MAPRESDLGVVATGRMNDDIFHPSLEVQAYPSRMSTSFESLRIMSCGIGFLENSLASRWFEMRSNLLTPKGSLGNQPHVT